MSNRSPQYIAHSHNYSEIQKVLSKYIQEDEIENDKMLCKDILKDISTWHDYYPGLRDENRFVA